MLRNAISPLILLLCLFAALPAAAENTAAPVEAPPTAAQTPAPPAVPEGLRTPRAALGTFLRGMNDVKRERPEGLNDALTSLDLSQINHLIRKEKGPDLAWMLLEAMDRTRVVDLEKVPDYQAGEDYIFEQYAEGDIRIVRMEDGRWLFSARSLEDLPKILDGLAGQERVKGSAEEEAYLPLHLRIREKIPENLRPPLLILELWQWLGLFLIVVVGVVLDKLFSFFLRMFMKLWLDRRTGSHYWDLSPNLLRPLGLMAMAAVWWGGLNALGLPENVLVVLLVAAKFLAGFSAVWGLYRLVDMGSAYFQERASKTENRLDDVLVPLLTRVSKIFVTVLGIVFLADNMELDVTSLLAGLGLAGMAVALAAKDALENLFGSITVLMDRSFHVGDWVIIGDVEGTVESIGFRSTRVRTFYNSLITMPNSRLITAEVDNMGRRRYRRFKCWLNLAYETPPEKVEAFCEGLREIVRLHPHTRKDYFHIYLNQFSAASIDVLVYIFFAVPDWGVELRERHRFLLDSMRLAERLGVEFAYPTQTLYLKRGGENQETGAFTPAGVDDALSIGRREAEEIVKNSLNDTA